MPNLEHQRIVDELGFAINLLIREHAGGRKFSSPTPIRLWEGKIREPDLVYYAAGREDCYHVQYADPPDLAIEVLSPSTRRIDREEKAAEYAEAGVTEYWIVDPEGRAIEVLTGAGSEGYTSRRSFGPGDEAASAVLPGLVVSVAEFDSGGIAAELSYTPGEVGAGAGNDHQSWAGRCRVRQRDGACG